MTPDTQTAIALSLVVLAASFFFTRWVRGRKKPGCGGGCGCSSTKKF
ncbi:MAG: FeoB-associated Cys-rich membrane protein [Proteobacteria bacterium]|nr:FeoB-associated Cys-rich membrane protein [Pseudomonadota bacterium]